MPRINQVNVGREVISGGSVGRQHVGAPIEAFGGTGKGLQKLGAGVAAVGGGLQRVDAQQKAEQDRLEREALVKKSAENKSDFAFARSKSINRLNKAKLEARRSTSEQDATAAYNAAWEDINKMQEGAFRNQESRLAFDKFRELERESRTTEWQGIVLDINDRETTTAYKGAILEYQSSVVDTKSYHRAKAGIKSTVDANHLFSAEDKKAVTDRELAVVERSYIKSRIIDLEKLSGEDLDDVAGMVKELVVEDAEGLGDQEKQDWNKAVDGQVKAIRKGREQALTRAIKADSDASIEVLLTPGMRVDQRNLAMIEISSSMKEKYGDKASKAIRNIQTAVAHKNKSQSAGASNNVRYAYYDSRSADQAREVLEAEYQGGRISGDDYLKSNAWLKERKWDDVDKMLKGFNDELKEMQKSGDLEAEDLDDTILGDKTLKVAGVHPVGAAVLSGIDFLRLGPDAINEVALTKEEALDLSTTIEKIVRQEGTTDPARVKAIADTLLYPSRQKAAIMKYEGDTLKERLNDANRKADLKKFEGGDKFIKEARQSSRSVLPVSSLDLAKIMELKEKE